MLSIAALSTVLFALVATSNAFDCNPVTCMLACPFGLEVDARGCPYCSCRPTFSACVDPIFGYNCGAIDHRDCPSSHTCQFSSSGLTGQCCLKSGSSTTGAPRSTTPHRVTGTSSARGTTAGSHTSTGRGTTPGSRTSTARGTTGVSGASTRRSFKRSFTGTTTAGTGATTADATLTTAYTYMTTTRPYLTSTLSMQTTAESAVTTGRDQRNWVLLVARFFSR